MSRKSRKIIANIIIVALLISGAIWIASMFIHIGKEYTNNAQVQQDIIVVSSRVQGFAKKIYFNDFQYVKKGDTLLIIEDSEFRLRVAQAEADYQNALIGKSAMGTTISTTQNNLSVSDAGIEEVKILLQNAEKEEQRYKNLLEKGAVTHQQYDDIRTKYESLKAKLETIQRQKKSTNLVKSEQTQRLCQYAANIAVCEAALNLAKLNLSYTVILAPCNGYTSRKSIQEGELLMPGKNLVSVISEQEPWIMANYRETQLQHIKIGSKVEIEIDAYPNEKFEGTVSAISDATGSEYSITRPDNSVGNFVKVEQRVPVKIQFTDQNDLEMLNRLQSGMNAECKINY